MCPPEESDGSCTNYSTEEPVRYATGQLRVVEVDLSYEGYGLNWAVVRAFGNIYTFGSNVYGNNWSNRFTPTLTVTSTNATLRISPSQIYHFTRSGNTFTPRFYFAAYISLTLNTTTEEFELRSPNGRMYIFDGQPTLPPEKPFKRTSSR